MKVSGIFLLVIGGLMAVFGLNPEAPLSVPMVGIGGFVAGSIFVGAASILNVLKPETEVPQAKEKKPFDPKEKIALIAIGVILGALLLIIFLFGSTS